MVIANNKEEKPLIIFTFKELCNGEQLLAAQLYVCLYSDDENIFQQLNFTVFFRIHECR